MSTLSLTVTVKLDGVERPAVLTLDREQLTDLYESVEAEARKRSRARWDADFASMVRRLLESKADRPEQEPRPGSLVVEISRKEPT